MKLYESTDTNPLTAFTLNSELETANIYFTHEAMAGLGVGDVIDCTLSVTETLYT